MAGESISIPILTPGADAAARNIKQVGNASAETAGKLDIAAASLALWNEQAAKSAKADATLVSSKRAHAKADALLADAENVLAGKATKTTKLLADQGRTLDNAGKAASSAAAGLTGLAGTGGIAGGGMGALIAAGVLLSPVLVSLAFGAAGFGAAAYGVAKPIEKAAQATGGLQKNLHTLDAEQQTVARGLLALGKQYGAFQAALKPTVLKVFNSGVMLAGQLLHEVQPVAVSFGKAFAGFLGQLDKMFASGEWQSFFAFMARTVGPDLKLVGSLFVNLASDLPPLVVALQPVASVLLKTADAIALTARAAEQLSGGPLQAMEQFGKSGQSIKDSSTGVSGFNAALDILIGPKQTHSVDNFFHSLHEGFNILTGAEKGALKPTRDTAASLSQWKTVTETVVTETGRLGKETDITTSKVKVFTGTTQSVISELKAQAKQLNITAAGYENALGPLETYIGAQIAERNDLVTLNQDLKKSHDAIGLKTAAERNSFGAAQTYIADTIKQGNAALAAHQGIDAQIRSIKNALPELDSVKGKTAAYRQELGLLKGILDKLRAERLIQENVVVSGTGQWSYRQSGVGHAVGPGGAASGAFIRQGTTSTADDVLARVSKGEVIVPARMVSAGAVDHLRGSIPGFATGGIAGSYHGPVAGLPPWTSHNQQATIHAITASIAHAFVSAFKAMTGFGAPGPGGGAPAANAALARRMMPAWGSGAEWAAWNYVAMRESGWNQYARNPSSGAYGIPQALPPGKMGPAANPPSSNPAAQISWMIGYIRGRYGDPIGAAAHERGFGWYDKGGVLPPGLSLAYNGTGRPEMVLPPGGRGGGGVTVVVKVDPVIAAVTPDRRLGQHIAQHVTAAIRGGMALYPAGVTPR